MLTGHMRDDEHSSHPLETLGNQFQVYQITVDLTTLL